ncbi:MAG: hypothetical protein WC119_00145 [Synergistaceae bacterium]
MKTFALTVKADLEKLTCGDDCPFRHYVSSSSKQKCLLYNDVLEDYYVYNSKEGVRMCDKCVKVLRNIKQ